MTTAPSPEAATRLAQDWQTIWQTELAGMAQDREAAEMLVASAQLWQALGSMMSEAAHAGAPKPNTTDVPPRSAPADAASGAGDAEAETIRLRVAELDRRLAELADTAPARRHRRPTAAKRRIDPA